jgi:hypothetical protein
LHLAFPFRVTAGADFQMSEIVHYLRSPHATASPVGERIVLYHRVSRTAIVLNPTGGWLWGRLGTPRSALDLARDLRERYPMLSAEDAERDVSGFLTELTQHAMVATAAAQ